MSRVLIFSTILMTTALLVGAIFFPTNPIMWLGSTSADFVTVRAILIVLLIILLFTDPPRNILLRVVLGLSSIALLSWVSLEIYTYSILVLDVGIFMLAGIILAIEALEPRLESMEEDTNMYIDSLSLDTVASSSAAITRSSQPSHKQVGGVLYSRLFNSPLVRKNLYLYVLNEDTRHGR